MSASAWQSYFECLKEGSIAIPEIRTFLCGPGRAGKTSLQRSLVDEKFEEDSDSTVGMELSRACCTVGENSVWKRTSDDKQREMMVANLLARSAVNNHGLRSPLEAFTSRPVQRHSDYTTKRQPSAPTWSKSPPAHVASGKKTTYAAAKPNPARSIFPAMQSKETVERAVEAEAEERMERKSDHLVGAANVNVQGTPSPSSSLAMLPEAADVSAAAHAINAADDLVSNLRRKCSVFAEVALDDLSFVTMWDFGGQEAFAVVQHLLMSYARSAYGVVFNASLPLDDPICNTFREDGKEHEMQRAKRNLPTNFEVMAEWLDVLHHILHLSRCNSSKVLLYLIGCQIDQIKPDAERKTRLAKIKRDIQRRIKGKPYEHDIDDIVFVDNTLSGVSTHTTDPGVARLRRDLVQNMISHASMQIPLPLRWLPFTIAMKSLAEKHGSPVVPLAIVKEIAANACSLHSKPEADNLLSFHHHLGHILHFSRNKKLNESVVVDVAWLVKVVSLLFAPPSVKSEMEIHREFREAYRLLFNRGLLLESLAEHIWECYCPKHAEHLKLPSQREYVFTLMEEFALLVTAHDSVVIDVQYSQTERLYWVPALAGLEVTEVEEEEAFLNPEKGSTHASTRRSPHVFLHLSHGQQLPRPLFWRVVVRCLQRFRNVTLTEGAQPKLYRSSVRLMCDSCHWLLLRRYQRGLQVTVEREVQNGRFTRSDKDQLAAKCREMLSFIEGTLLSQASETFAELMWCVSVRCRCDPDKEKCDHHKRASCPFADCHHFVPLDQQRCEKDGSRKQDVGSATFYWRHVSTQCEKFSLSIATNTCPV